MKKCPEYLGSSWIAFHDKLQRENPKLLENKTIIFKTLRYPTPEDIHKNINKVYSYKIKSSTLKRYCWEEMNELRLSSYEISTIHYGLSKMHSEDRINRKHFEGKKVNSLLQRVERNGEIFNGA